MGRLCSGKASAAIAVLSLWTIIACGYGGKPGSPIFPGKITLTPSTSTSIEPGSTLIFTATATTASNTNINTTFTFSSSDTGVLTIAPNGVACAGHFDIAFTTCTPGGTGVAQVTATALGVTSVPTFVFVHPHVDSIVVTGVLLNNIPPQGPCLSQGQSMTVQAQAFSQGVDVSASVGPFTWSANNGNVVKLTPLVNSAYNFPTNQATATAVTPGITQIYATASDVSSSSFQQAQFSNSLGTSPLLDFFATCPIQNISLEMGEAGSGQTGFVVAKGSSVSQTVIATVTDIMGNSSLPNTDNGVVLSTIPLTWIASQPGAIATSSGCTLSCQLTVPSPGSGTITASCSPPTCNIGFPQVPASLAACSPSAPVPCPCDQFFDALAPKGFSCQQLIPVPVYASPVFVSSSGTTSLLPATGAISGLVTGAPAAASVVATSTGCEHVPPATCGTSAYSVSTSKATAGNENAMSAPPNSLVFDVAGDRAFIGSDFGAQVLNAANLGGTSPAFTPLGTVTGTALAASTNGFNAVFSDKLHTPNQVYAVNATTPGSPTITPLSISDATAAAFSPDGLKTLILGNSGSSLYVYSALEALQTPGPDNPQLTLSAPGSAIAFSPSGAFAFVAEATAPTAPTPSANLTTFATCNNQVVLPTVPLPTTNLPAAPNHLLMKVLPNAHINGKDSLGNPIPDGIHIFILDASGFDIISYVVTSPLAGTLCPQGLTFATIQGITLPPVERIELNQGTLQPLNFFLSPDASLIYIVNANSANILVFDFAAGSVNSAIPLVGDPIPLSADMSVDGGTIAIAGSDGLLHEVSTSLGGADLTQLSFPNLPDSLNPFCTFTPASGPCAINLIAVRP